MPFPDIDNDNLEISFSVASAEPYKRYDEEADSYYYERLAIDEEAINFTRLNGGASVLKNHDSDHTLGVVKAAWIEDGKVCVRAAFRKNDPDAVATFKDAAEGRLPNVSIGYIPDTVVPVTENGLEFRDVTHWTPFEVSVAVGVPADATVGFYRSFTLKPTKREGSTMADPTNEEQEQELNPCEKCEHKDCKLEMQQKDVEEAPAEAEEEKEPAPAEPPAEPEHEQPAEVPPEEEKEEETEPEVRSMNTRTVPEVKIKSFNIPKKGAHMPEKKYSLVRAIQSLINPEAAKADLEIQRSNEIFRSIGKMPPSRNSSIMLSFRDGEFDGGENVGKGLIGTDHRADLFVYGLRTRMGVKGATVLSGLTGDVEIPVQTGASTVGIGAINSSAGKTKPTVKSVTLSPKKFSAYVTVGEDLIAQGNPDAISFVIDDLQAQIARKLDLAILAGCADPAIAGVDGTTGVQTQVIANMASATWANMLSMYGKVADYEIEDGDLAWITKGTTKAALMGISKDSGSGRFLCEDDKINGYQVNVCGGLTDGALYFGCWKNVIIGQWGGLQVKIDDVTGIKEGSVTIVAKLLADIAITNPAAFVRRVASAS